MSVFQNFPFECMVSIVCVIKTAKVDISHYNISLNHNKLIGNFNLFQPNKFSKFTDRLHTCIVKPRLFDVAGTAGESTTAIQNNLCIIW